MKAVKKINLIAYFSELPAKIQELVKELIFEAADKRGGPDCYKTNEEAIEAVECMRRDGFIPFASNRGGLVYRNFTDLMGYWGGGYSVSHEGAQANIESQIEYSLQCASNDTYAAFKPFFDAHGIKPEQVTYSNLEELSTKAGSNTFDEVLQHIQDAELENLSDDQSSIMHEIRFLYHGQEDGEHSASVSAAVNTEGPYHRSHISWSPGTFCEGAKEVEITWRTQSELKKKLTAALAKVSKAIF